jgi:hypothetical protein
MAGLRPFFLTGANAKIVINGKTLAYCSDFSCQVQVMHQTPKVLGMYEGVSVEPLSYNVAGGFNVIKYVKGAIDATGSSPNGVDANGDGVGNWGNRWGNGVLRNLGVPFAGNDGRADEALDPSKYSQGTSFDIVVYQKTPSGDIGVYNIRSARITAMSFNVSKTSPGVDTYQFVALYVDGDNFVADPSGQGQNTSV